MKASVLILTFNEEINIRRCLESVKFSDDVLVVDSFSSDRTLDIVDEFKNVTVIQNKFVDFSTQRNFGLEHYDFKNETVIHLDADEECTVEFVSALGEVDFSEFDVVDCANRIIMNGKWLRYSSGYPVYQSRVAHKDIRFEEVGHGQKILKYRKKTTLCVPYNHYNFSHGLASWFSKHIRYAEKEAAKYAEDTTQIGGGGLRRLLYAHTPLSWRPVARFVYLFFFKRGFLDGWIGLQYSLMLAIYEMFIVMLVLESKSQKNDLKK